MRNAKFWINKTSNQNIEEFTIIVLINIYFYFHYNEKNLSKFCSIYSGQLRLRLSVIEKQLIKNGHLSLWLDFI
jgi:hypothetical protein